MQPQSRLVPSILRPLLVPKFPFGNALVSKALLFFFLASASQAEPLSYNRDIRPILSNNCFKCHGPDKATREAGLRLDVAEAAYAEQHIVPGDPAASEIIQRIITTDPDDLMPPQDSGLALTPQQIDTLKRWVSEGAAYEDHWAYLPPQEAPVPAVNDPAWVRNPIDAFVLSTIEKEGLRPAPEADKATLIRRLSLDLAGLPPDTAEIDAFLADNSPDAYERLVERLLASPHFGERMAVEWLDVVRYADTNGYHSDENRSAYPYRDYVIESFNKNKPYDQFTIEQLAGDLLPNATREQRVGAAYNRMNQITAEGGAQAKEYIEKYAADRVRTASTVWMGSTFGCAQCHDHKYDPFSMRDFYSFSAFFADIEEQGVYGGGSKWEPVLELPTEEQEKRLAELNTGIAEAQRTVDTPTDALANAQRIWEAKILDLLQSDRHVWANTLPAEAKAANGTELKPQEDASVLATGPAPGKEVYEVQLKTEFSNLTGLRLEALPEPTGVGRGNGNFVLSGIEIRAAGQPIAIASAVADHEQATWPIAGTLDNDPNTGWAVDGHLPERKAQPRQAVFRFAQPLPAGPGTVLTAVLRFETVWDNHTIARFRFTVTTEESPQLDGADPVPLDIKLALIATSDTRIPEQVDALAKYFRANTPLLQPAREQLATLTKQRDELRAQIPYVLATKSIAPRTVRVLPRGNWMDETGEVVEPSTPTFLPALLRSEPGKRLTRLDLAQWLVSRDNPLTARVYVNRLWAMYFGQGLSRVLDDLGIQGEWPTHPELLDWLALEFMDNNWDVKHMVRLIVTSSTYRQASVARRELDELDPYNKLLARQARFRLAAEFVRDNALGVAGLLSSKVGGPVIMPYQPDGYYNDCNTFRGPMVYDTSQGEDQYRRGLYTYWKRSFLHPSMLAFDAPSREECTAMRPASNTPLQALVLLNDPTYVEAARAFAERILRDGGADTATRVRYAFRRATGRPATDEEAALLAALLEKHLHEYTTDTASASVLLQVGQHPVPGDLHASELAAWTSVARAILNLHETITRS